MSCLLLNLWHPGAMDLDLPTEVGPTEETFKALLEYLVGPLLPLKHIDTAKGNPSESQQKAVAKQVHAVALLYNYYHRKYRRELEFLAFDQFCNLATMFKPSILQYLKYMCQPDRPSLDDVENQLSLTEKSIMDACTISGTLLDTSSDISSFLEEWPITTVAVLLIDSKKENCWLQFNNGIWSVIEKDLHSENNGNGSGGKTNKKRKRDLIGKHEVDDEAGFRKFAFSAVKEVTGVPESDLKVLESRVTYSLSRAKTATQFYIVQCTQLVGEDHLVPVYDAVCSLQGPVVKRSSRFWVITPVVEYYYLLPYAEVMSEWFSRVSDNFQHHVVEGNTDANIFQGSQNLCEKDISEGKSVSSDKLHNNMMQVLENVYVNNSSKEEPCDMDVTENRSTSCEQYTTLEPVCKEADYDTTSEMIRSPCDKEIIQSENAIFDEREDTDSDGMVQNDAIGKEREDTDSVGMVQNDAIGKEREDTDSVGMAQNDAIGKEREDTDSVGMAQNDAIGKEREDTHSDGMAQKEAIGKEREDTHSDGVALKEAIGKEREDTDSDGMTQKDMDESCTVEQKNSTNGVRNDIDGPVVSLQKENQNKNAHTPLIVYHHQKRSAATKAISTKNEHNGLKSTSSMSEERDEKVDEGRKSVMISPDRDRIQTVDRAVTSFQHSPESLERLQSTIAAKGSELSQAALRALLVKREKLCYQLRNTEDELALCDKKIQEILNSGTEDGLDLKLETIIDCCNEMCKQDDIQAQEFKIQHLERDLSPFLPLSGRKLAEAQLTLRKSCQELDDICRVNNWALPKYCTSHSNGGFVANVTVKGSDFECSEASGAEASTREARNSAAALVIAKLQQMANNTL